MNRLESKPQNTAFALPPASCTDLEPVRRLIILIPADADYSTATRRIWKLASAMGSNVQFLGLCKDAALEPGLRRELVTMSALVQDGRVATEVKIKIGTDWIHAIKSDCQPGDLIVCFAEQRAGLLHKPLSQILQAKLHVPVFIISDLHVQNVSQPNWRSQILAWAGSLGIIIGSFLVQIRIASLPQDWAQTTVLILSVIGEVWLIWGWNSLFS